jgi:hypothetical protein
VYCITEDSLHLHPCLQVAQENLAMRQAALRMAQAQAQANLQKHQKSQQP